jgi:hypothetical protein
MKRRTHHLRRDRRVLCLIRQSAVLQQHRVHREHLWGRTVRVIARAARMSPMRYPKDLRTIPGAAIAVVAVAGCVAGKKICGLLGEKVLV